MQEIKMYKAFDGKVFKDEEKCKSYDAEITNVALLKSIMIIYKKDIIKGIGFEKIMKRLQRNINDWENPWEKYYYSTIKREERIKNFSKVFDLPEWYIIDLVESASFNFSHPYFATRPKEINVRKHIISGLEKEYLLKC